MAEMKCYLKTAPPKHTCPHPDCGVGLAADVHPDTACHVCQTAGGWPLCCDGYVWDWQRQAAIKDGTYEAPTGLG